ncbi:hypothetical protein SAMN05428949_3855 [Chitinophaga sp. YR627]|uniref:hypothetical protein n=1 Tax=Chitinophaga sp. YR627 TaxID=1881041 RepID=UPI0008E910DF|nr:hypothetical protein [Chitinophaga sp. YR627]SFN91961.1 hypothetical protein SAMN05428949_3855 [Chitinophaga sp. YR627]
MNTLKATQRFELAAVNVRTLICLNLVIISFMDSFVMWNDLLPGKLFTYGLKALNILSLLYLMQRSRPDKYAWVLLYLPLTWFVIEEGSIPGSIQYFYSSSLPVVSFLLLRDDEQVFVVTTYLKIIAALFIPGIVIYVLINVAALPHLTYLRDGKRVYENYFFLCYSLPHIHFRFFSVFDEPGVIGTLSALVVFYYKELVSRRVYILYIICGILSVSLFFIIVLFPMLYFSNIRSVTVAKRWKKVARFSMVLVLMYFSFIVALNSMKDNPLIKTAVYNRFKWENGLIVGIMNNRDDVLPGFDAAFTNFSNRGGSAYWFGRGKGTTVDMFGASALSYRISLFEKGALIMIYVVFLMLLMHPVRKNFLFSIISVLFICMLLYQRPFFYKIDYFTLIFVGVRFIPSYERKKENSTYSPQPV